MKVTKTVKLEMSKEEKEAIKTVYRMLYDLDWEEEKLVADEFDYEDLIPMRDDLATLYELGGGDREEL